MVSNGLNRGWWRRYGLHRKSFWRCGLSLQLVGQLWLSLVVSSVIVVAVVKRSGWWWIRVDSRRTSFYLWAVTRARMSSLLTYILILTRRMGQRELCSLNQWGRNSDADVKALIMKCDAAIQFLKIFWCFLRKFCDELGEAMNTSTTRGWMWWSGESFARKIGYRKRK